MKKMIVALMLFVCMPVAHAAELVVSDAWVRLPPPVAKDTAAYMTVENRGREALRIVGISCDAVDAAGLHGMRMDGARMMMFALPAVDIPAGGEAIFAPGGSHVMLMGLHQPLKSGERITLNLQLSSGEVLPVAAEVRDMRMNHGHHGGMH
ncbi:copper chaperone PCu(A)C [Mariprofundus erugo]|uniref:Copper chaperone PCu(A)C n=1 Tax=Mariprofundus erugo TaxID=2528639 RepID=A0A5R9GU05_9PROT|nr:copper chaperone PCu(A)C [Mariprofundus erugo]TLS68525.1 copper chaperone PCu(A)C [Mariprofundus erugo]TLS76883.1 copper chaperone PCu(A)C [Mariprofundus erugo]